MSSTMLTAPHAGGEIHPRKPHPLSPVLLGQVGLHFKEDILPFLDHFLDLLEVDLLLCTISTRRPALGRRERGTLCEKDH